MELRKSDLELFEKIKLHVLKILNNIREAYKSLGYKPTSAEANALLGMKDVIEKFYSMFEEAAVDATQNYQALGTEGYNEFVAKSTNNANKTEAGKERFVQSFKQQAKKVIPGMSDTDRYSVLKDAKIIAISDLKSETQPIYNEIEKIPEKAKGQVERLIKDLADDLEILNVPLSTAALDIEFQLSKNNGLKESLSQQLKYGGNFHDFAKALINLRDILERAVLIEAHTEDRYKGKVREDINFEAGYVLFSAFKSKEYIIPVKLEIKQKKDAQNILYVVVSMTKIKRISVMESALDDTEVPTIPLSDTDSVYSLPHLVSKINPQDRNFLKYLPDQMLSAEQQEAKDLALEEDKRKLDAMPNKSNSVKKLNETLEENNSIKKQVKKPILVPGTTDTLSQTFVDDTLNSFDINNLGDFEEVQESVFKTLLKEGFFTETNPISRKDVNDESGMVIETNKRGIDETFCYKNYTVVGRFKKIVKLATIRELPNAI